MQQCCRIFWCGPWLQHIRPSRVRSLLAQGQVRLCVEAQAEEKRQVRGTGWPCPLGMLPPAAAETGWLPGSFASKAGRIFSRDHLVSYSRGRQRAGCRSRSFTGKGGGPAGRSEPRSPHSCQGRAWEVRGGLRGGEDGHIVVREVWWRAMLSLGWKPLSVHHQPQPHICFINQSTRLSDVPSFSVTVASDGGWKGCWPFKVESSFPLLLRQMQFEPSAEPGTESLSWTQHQPQK